MILNHVGVDPGFEGGIARINQAGTVVEAFDMPVTKTEKERQREYDLPQLRDIFRRYRQLPGSFIQIEWPTTRPGEGAERSERFGRGKGYLHAFAFLICGPDKFRLVPPNLWKGRLGLPGKSDPQANPLGAKLFKQFYPDHAGLIYGPRGGILSGKLDALLIAHWSRMSTMGGLTEVVKRFGKGSDEAMLALFGRGNTKKPKGII